ncbi:hypothetical protein WJX84_003725 [Apatococcus fuscideae]|uniref:Uncharacterized protein n=1 Tax=Apatococcus fuscideae TaxID=2026836 RepID=A0AAW1T9E5_9CHLO
MCRSFIYHTVLKLPIPICKATQPQELQQAAGLLKQLQHLAPQARAALHAVQQPLLEAVDEASRREDILQHDFAPLCDEMRSLRQQRARLLEERQELHASIAALHSQHTGLTQEIKNDQARLDELNGKIVNASPLNQMKAAIQRLNGELQDMQIATGVALQRLQIKS